MNLLSKISNHPSFSKGVIFFDQALVSGSNFLLGILLVRWVGLDNYGVFALLWMGVLFALGINQAFITKPLLSIAPKLKAADQSDYLDGLHAIQVVVSVLFLCLGMMVFFFSEFIFEKEITQFIPILSGIIFCQMLYDYYRKVGFLDNNIIKVLVLDMLLYGGQIIGVIGLIYFEKIDLFSVLFLLLGLNIITVIVGVSNQRISIKNYKKILVRHFHFSKWLLGTSILQWLSGNYFIIVGASILGTSAVGAVRMVQNIMGLCHVLFLAMENVIPIEAARRFYAEGELALNQYLLKITYQLGLGFCIVLLGITLFSSQILEILYGEEAIKYSYIIYAYSVLYVFVFLGHPLRFYLRTIEKTYPIFIAYIFGTVFSLSFAHLLLVHFDMYGLLFGLLATQFLTLVTYYFFIKKKNVAIPANI